MLLWQSPSNRTVVQLQGRMVRTGAARVSDRSQENLLELFFGVFRV